MEPEVIDWDNIDSVFIEDDTYENLNAPKWVDFSASPEQPVDDDAWFCKPGCKHPKTVEDYLRSKRGSKVKFLKSATISEMLPFRERNSRVQSVHSFREDCENKSPNLSNINNLSKKLEIRLSEAKEQRDEDLHASSTKAKPRTTFSSRNLLGGKEVLSQITEFCFELKGLEKKETIKRSTKKDSSGVLSEMERENERMPLLALKERQAV
ncbi:interferon-activable protein [Salix suchowensis]|nr:interferon-activable protein [Salix suchowensis]